jgi:hypothetical protein
MLAVIPCTTIPMLRFGPRRPFMAAAVPTNDLIDFPCAPVFAAYYADQRMTPRLPDGYPVEQPQKWEPLPIRDINEPAWDSEGAAVLRLIGWMNSVASQYPAEEWHNHLPGTPPTDQPANVTTFRPREEPAKEPLVAPEPIRHQWRHL